MNKTIVITGGTGLIGSYLINLLHKEGHEVRILTRGKNNLQGKVKYFHWNPSLNQIDSQALTDATDVINLAGMPVIRKWTAKNKQKIVDSRTQSISTIKNELLRSGQKINCFISASAIGIYPDSELLQDENSPVGNGYYPDISRYWEIEAKTMEPLCNRIVIPRIGVVLTPKAGALAPLTQLSKFCVGSAVGSGRQYLSWIHINDLLGILNYSLNKTEVNGVINAVSPDPVTNASFMKTLAQTLKRPILSPKVPNIILKLMLGERSILLTTSSNISCKKIEDAGYQFKYPTLSAALTEIFQKN